MSIFKYYFISANTKLKSADNIYAYVIGDYF